MQRTSSVAPGIKDSIRSVPIFVKLNQLQLHELAKATAHARFEDGEPIVQQGEPGDAMYIIERGGCFAEVEGVGVVKRFATGDCFGEASLLTREPRGASVLAEGSTSYLVLAADVVSPILEQCWGGQKELQRREELLKRVKLFAELTIGELRQLATQLERVEFETDGSAVFTEGTVGHEM